MFQRQMKSYVLEVPEATQNEYNESILVYHFDRNVEMAICADNKVMYGGNETLVFNVEYAALTKDRHIKKGDRIDGKYIVDHVEVSRLYTVVHMKEIANSGRLQG